jgi:hypothetical protein
VTHKLNKAKIEDYLTSKGWHRGPHHEWEVPQNFNEAELETIWTEAILQGIVCEFEDEKKVTQEFLDKHPTSKR